MKNPVLRYVNLAARLLPRPSTAHGMEALLLLLLLYSSSAFGQRPDTLALSTADTANGNDTITFVARFSKRAATKDGYYVGPYVVVLEDSIADRLDGKQVRLTGSYYVVPGLGHQPQRTDERGEPIIMQGRAEDKGHVVITRIEEVPE